MERIEGYVPFHVEIKIHKEIESIILQFDILEDMKVIDLLVEAVERVHA